MWRDLVNRAHVSARLTGELTLALLLVVSLATYSRDGARNDGNADTVSGTLAAAWLRAHAVPGVPHLSALAGTTEVSATEMLIPTAPPVQLLIPSLDVHRPVEAVGVDGSGVMNLPANYWNAGWYEGGPVPGAPGDAVIEGHAGYPGQPLIFGKLITLRTGDKIVVVLADGSRHLFLVESMASVSIGSAPPGMAEPYGPPRLTLITCTGHFDKNTYSYSSRLVVEASYAGLA